MRILLAEWVSPFGHPRIKVCCRLPEAFRRLPRPSSPLTAKASTVCACSLDPITPKRLSALDVKQTSISLTCLNDTFRSFAPVHGLYSVALGRAPNACYVPSCQRTKPGLQRPASKPLGSSDLSIHPSVLFLVSVRSRDRFRQTGGASRVRTDDPLLAKQVLYQLSYGPIVGGGSGRTRTTGLTLIRGAL